MAEPSTQLDPRSGQLDFERCYRAVDSRDQRFDGWFCTAVTSTGIYCRPSCPATTPKRENVLFYPTAAAAQRAGFRACRRCRPDAAPGSPEWDVRADVVARAMRLIADGVVDRDGVSGLARRLGYTERHLQRILTAELGAGPLALARAQRAQTARILIETTDLDLGQIAFAAGFGSVRQFNETLRAVYAVTPSALRPSRPVPPRTDGTARRAGGAAGAPAPALTPGTTGPPATIGPPAAIGTPGTIVLRLAYRSALHAQALLEFFAARAVAGVEEVDAQTYRRALRLPHGTATVALTPRPGYVSASLRLADARDLAPAVARCRRLLDLDADPVAVDATLAADPALAPVVAKEPGVRLPRAVDGFEIAVRAVAGQQISVAGARTVLAKLLPPLPLTLTPVDQEENVSDHGVSRQEPLDQLRPFPSAEEVLALPDAAFAMPAARRETIRALARAVAVGELELDPGADRQETERQLARLPGIGAWTAGYLALRALGDPDVFLAADLGVRRGAGRLGLPTDPKTLDEYARRWSPWRSYAVIRLWRHS